MVSLAQKKQAVGLKLSLSNQLARKLSKLNETLQLVTFFVFSFFFTVLAGNKMQTSTSNLSSILHSHYLPLRLQSLFVEKVSKGSYRCLNK